MDMTELAKKMLEWEELTRQANALADEISAAVLEIGSTQVVGNVRATYSEGRKSYDYYAAWNAVHKTPPGVDHTKVSYDYRKACADYGIDDIPFTQGDPSRTS